MLNPLLYAFASEWMRVHLAKLVSEQPCLKSVFWCLDGNKNYSSANESVYDYKKPKTVIKPNQKLPASLNVS